MKKSGRKFSLMELSLIGILAAMFILFSILNGTSFFGSYNLLNILKAAGAMAIMVLGDLGAGRRRIRLFLPRSSQLRQHDLRLHAQQAL